MLRDHQNIYLFVFSTLYLKSCGQFNDFEWKIFIEGEINTLEDQKHFESSKSGSIFKALKSAISIVSSAATQYILPLIPYNNSTPPINHITYRYLFI